jgi:hypothetical protein
MAYQLGLASTTFLLLFFGGPSASIARPKMQKGLCWGPGKTYFYSPPGLADYNSSASRRSIQAAAKVGATHLQIETGRITNSK